MPRLILELANWTIRASKGSSLIDERARSARNTVAGTSAWLVFANITKLTESTTRQTPELALMALATERASR